MKKILLGLLLFTFSSCDELDESSNNRNIQWIEYDINSIRVDDDAEYHIVATNSQYGVLALHDEDVGFDIKIQYGNTDKPVLLRPIEFYDKGKMYAEVDNVEGVMITIKLPIGYKIDTFDD